MTARVWAALGIALAACNSGGSGPASGSPDAPIGSNPALPVISSFGADPSTLPAGGGDVTLHWTVSGADTLGITPNVGTVSGTSTQVTGIRVTTTYTLHATNAAGSVTMPVTVTVSGSTSSVQVESRRRP